MGCQSLMLCSVTLCSVAGLNKGKSSGMEDKQLIYLHLMSLQSASQDVGSIVIQLIILAY